MDAAHQQQLVERARGGDADAWVALYERVYPRLRAYARRNGGMDAADDLVNETMARAVAGIGRFRWQDVDFDAWLFGILRRVCADHHRSAARRRREPPPTGVHDDDVGDDLVRRAEHEQVTRAFARLTPPERELLELRVIAGLSAEDVGRILKKRPGAVRMAQSRALAHLRQLLEQAP